MMNRPVLLGLDWGTSNFRAYQIAEDGTVLDRLEEPLGTLHVPDGGFEAALQELIGHWLIQHESLPVIGCGMVGSRHGWSEAPYVDCPATADDVARRTISIDLRSGHQVHIIPGLVYFDANDVPDVMRGEETQIIGTLRAEHSASQWIALPGTHSKWAETEDGCIKRFATFMTGELYELLRNHSILGRMMDDSGHEAAAFRRGVNYSTKQGGLLRHLFSVRSLPLLDKLPRTGVASYLSGLLIGSEIDGAMRGLHSEREAEPEVLVLGSVTLADLYANALRIKGIRTERGSTDAVALGLLRIARLRRLL